MMNRTEMRSDRLTVGLLEGELKRIRRRERLLGRLRGALCGMTAVFAAVLLAVMWLPIVQISGGDMAPTLNRGDVVAVLRSGSVRAGDLIAFQAGSGKLLIKRMIAGAGDTVDILADGTVAVNGVAIHEPYAAEGVGGECDIDLPCVVPEGRIFVLGDNRVQSVDSRSSRIGCVAAEQIVGRAALKIWPINEMKMLLSGEQEAEE